MRGDDPTLTMYECIFFDYGGKSHRLDTTDPAKIGPWLAEMFALWPYKASTATSLQIETYDMRRPSV